MNIILDAVSLRNVSFNNTDAQYIVYYNNNNNVSFNNTDTQYILYYNNNNMEIV